MKVRLRSFMILPPPCINRSFLSKTDCNSRVRQPLRASIFYDASWLLTSTQEVKQFYNPR